MLYSCMPQQIERIQCIISSRSSLSNHIRAVRSKSLNLAEDERGEIDVHLPPMDYVHLLPMDYRLSYFSLVRNCNTAILPVVGLAGVMSYWYIWSMCGYWTCCAYPLWRSDVPCIAAFDRCMCVCLRACVTLVTWNYSMSRLNTRQFSKRLQSFNACHQAIFLSQLHAALLVFYVNSILEFLLPSNL